MKKIVRKEYISENNGFTLIELIISLALLGIVTLTVFSMQSFSLRVFDKGSGKYQVQSSTGIVTEHITQKLRYGYSVAILESNSLVPDVASITNNDAYIFVENSSGKNNVMFRDKNGTSILSSFDSCLLTFSASTSDRELGFQLSGRVKEETFNVTSGISSANLLLDPDRKITFDPVGITSGSAVKIVRDPVPIAGTGLTFEPAVPPVATIGEDYNTSGSYKLADYVASGGTPPYTFTAIPRLPYGITMDPATGLLGGNPVEPGVFDVAISVKDSSTPQKEGYNIIRIVVNDTVTYSNAAPRPSTVNVSGSINVGGTLTADVSGWIDSDGDDDPALSTYSYQWYVGSSPDGAGMTAISPGGTSQTFTVTAPYVNKYLFVKVTAQGNVDSSGSLPVFNSLPVSTTPPAAPNTTPEARDLSISGTTKAGNTLTGHYTYFDADSDVEGISQFKWYRSDKNDGTGLQEISDFTGLTYDLTQADKGNYIYFSVTPVSVSGVSPGTSVTSANVGKIQN